MGIVGAGIATLIARVIELLMVLGYIVFIEKRVRLKLSRMFRIPRTLAWDFIRYSLPVIGNETFWGLGITVHSVVIGNMGETAYAAYSVSNIIEKIGMLAVLGFANAALIVIGKEIGAGRAHNAYPYAKTILSISVLLGILTAGLMLAVRWPMINIFNVTSETKTAAMNIAAVMAAVIVAKSFNTTAVVGAIRGGGDTLTSMMFDFIPMWFFAIPLGAIAAHLIEIPVWWVYACLMSDEVVKMPLIMWRIISKKWIRNVTR